MLYYSQGLLFYEAANPGSLLKMKITKILFFKELGFILATKMLQNLSSIVESIFKEKRLLAGKFSQLYSVFQKWCIVFKTLKASLKIMLYLHS